MSTDAATSDTEVIDPHEEYDAPDREYIVIAAVLVVLTALEVAASYSGLGSFLVPLLLILMLIKFLTVVFYFMHLKFDNKMFRWLFFSGLVLAIFVYCVALATFHFFS